MKKNLKNDKWEKEKGEGKNYSKIEIWWMSLEK